MEFDQLIKHMSPTCRELFEQAVGTASSRSHFSVEIEHWLTQALEAGESELDTVLRHFDASPDRLQADLQAGLEALKTGNDGFPKIGPEVARLLFEGWMIASSQFSSLEIRPIHLLLALVENEALRLRAIKLSGELEKIHGDALREQCQALLDGSQQPTAATGTAGGDRAPTKTPALDQFTIDLTADAQAGRIERIIGRDDEIRQMIDILCRRRQNNPILTGEAGVGKTAVVEGLAVRIAAGDVPSALRGVSVRTLDLGLLQAGAGVKGEFENRLKNVIKEVQDSPTPVILFIDEAHTMIGAGNQAGGGDAANLLKPALARGELRTIAATTWAEYKKYFESDAALTRRFQVIKVDEPSEETAIAMLRNTTPSLEAHHNVAVLEEAVAAAVRLSHRYIAGRQLPDKCVSLLDTACARVNLSQNATPAAVERCQRQRDDVMAELDRLRNEQHTGHDHDTRITELEAEQDALQTELEALNNAWEEAHTLVSEAVHLRRQLEAIANGEDTSALSDSTIEDAETEPADPAALKARLQQTREQLATIQGENSLMCECVDAQVIAEVVADWTGIPVGRMQTDEINRILGLEGALQQRVIGQSQALELIARNMRTARAGLADPRRPLGVFLLVGPSGVGKTETAMALADQLYGSDQAITTINMSEFKEEHKVSLLMGSPPGYVGYGEGGVLTEAVRRKPYSVVLLDEVEKAHPSVQDIFYQVFDRGLLRDGEGRDIDFRNTVLILTSNTASEQIEGLCADPDTRPTLDGLREAIGPTLRDTYKPAFLGRVNIIPYLPLDSDALARIVGLQLSAIQERFAHQYHAEIHFTQALIDNIVERCNVSDTGARQISSVLNNELLPTLSQHILEHVAAGHGVGSTEVDADEDNNIVIHVTAESPTQTDEPADQEAALQENTTVA